MIDTILLIVLDPHLRQLYHEMLFSENIEVIPMGKVEHALVIETVCVLTALVVYTDDIEQGEVEAILRLQKQVERFSHTRIVLLTSDEEQYEGLLGPDDMVLDIIELSSYEIAEKIKEKLGKSK